MRSLNVAGDHQIPLIHEVHADDQHLLNPIDGEWFEILHAFPWADYRHPAGAYYDALYEFQTYRGLDYAARSKKQNSKFGGLSL